MSYNLGMSKDKTQPDLDVFFGNQRKQNLPDQQSLLEKFFEENLVKSILEKFHLLLKHPKSQSFPENPYLDDSDHSEYINQLAEYDDGQTEVDSYNLSHPEDKKINFIEDGNCNIGWKMHINVQPSNVKSISAYLKTNGYRHKFLHGGEVNDGKIFTIYIGDYNLARLLSKRVSTDLRNYLCKPTVKNEIELAPGVVGRFVGPKHIKNEFHQYGSAGFSWKKEFQSEISLLVMKRPPDYQERKKDIFMRAEYQSFSALLSLFDKYFYDIQNRL